MKRLILMRHAKSSWADPGCSDHDRPLNSRGQSDAPRIGAWLAAHGFMPDLALVSSARRTQETWTGLGDGFSAVPMSREPAIYEAMLGALLNLVQTAPTVDCLLLLGHMPAIGSLARYLLPADPDDADLLAYPTAATTVIGADIATWDALDRAGGRLLAFTTPRRLAA